MTRVLITGSRHWYCLGLAERVVNRLLTRYGPALVVVHGAARGVDSAFEEACRLYGVEAEAHPARWEELDHPEAVIRYDKRNRPYNVNAGPIRNQEMVAAGATFALAVHQDLAGSKGTLDCTRRALAAGIPVWHLAAEDAEPVRLTSV